MAPTESPSIAVSRRASASTGGDADCTIVWVCGEHDISTKVSLEAALARAAQLEDVGLLVDMSGVTFMDASTVGAIVGSRNRLRSRSQSLEVRSPSPLALRVLELCGLGLLVHGAPVGTLHPRGAAAALGTWVDVPPTRVGGGDREADGITSRPDARQPAGLAPASAGFPATTLGADRGGA